MKAEFLPQKALKLGRDLIIADLHLGYEISMTKEGVYLPNMFYRTVNLLKMLIEKEKPKRLIINGDLKHSFVPFKQEKFELKTFFSEISPLVGEIILVKGNHDVGILWTKELGIEIVDEIELGGWKIVHGHKLVEGEKFIIGHEHPAIRLRDEVGALIKVPVFLAGRNLIVLPAFSPWAYGNDILREIVSPFLRYFDVSESKVLVPLDSEILDFGSFGKLSKMLERV
ncbi:metallophosphoesterase [Thermococcus sp.]